MLSKINSAWDSTRCGENNEGLSEIRLMNCIMHRRMFLETLYIDCICHGAWVLNSSRYKFNRQSI